MPPKSLIFVFDDAIWPQTPSSDSPPSDTISDEATFTREELLRKLTHREASLWGLYNLVRDWYVDGTGFYRKIRGSGVPDKRVKYTEADFLRSWDVYAMVALSAANSFDSDLRGPLEAILHSNKPTEDKFSEGVRLRGKHNLPTRVPTDKDASGNITQREFPFMLDDFDDSDVRLINTVENHAKKQFEEGIQSPPS
ncbi:hypothetical protein CC2G_012416 [Coprinopsis cinerea AmutBmut pab1-1]|nr:hypothetical protein CC2G_012416 [Coprinopsis cinerea AmutBmut pab1-1]